ncbi:MAG: ParB/RepB/Spo0J family partition protein [Thermodesulfobacteriota bacterium]|nr:ParB/RepB/Spo0J family partition protein [Thermodesulfobacteriota bacterium]
MEQQSTILKSVKLASIDLEDKTYRITTRSDVDDLINSIKNIGLINPPLLKMVGSGYTIVCGFRRINACKSLGRLRIEAVIVDFDVSRLECVKLAITDNALQRQLNLVEKSRSINMLSRFYSDYKSLSKAASVLGLPENPSLIKKIESICKLPRAIQNRILSETVSLSVAIELGMFNSDIGISFANLFDDLKLSLNKQREIITFIKEISIRDDISIMEVLQGSDLLEILNDNNLDRSQKSQKVRFYLKQRRYPEITSADKQFRQNIKELRLGNNIRLIPPNNFEGATYILKLSFNNPGELQDSLEVLNSICQKRSMNKFFFTVQ